ncbi:hypothetical protein N7475_002724 [Penicillium sp. IBT 31633x]|nr:hypothetical protein N7475_002724 [Penicillium sp. IBT 31633x]
MEPRGNGVPLEPQASNDRLTALEDQAIMDYVEKWKNHGFQLKKQEMVSQIASAYLKHHGNSDSGTSRHHGIFARNRDFHEKFKKDRKLEKSEMSNKNPEVEDTRLCKFIDLFATIRSENHIQDEQIYALSDTGYATTIQKDRKPLNISRRRSSENRDLASVIYCYPAHGKPLSPYVIFKSSNVRGPKKYDGRVTISYNTTGWAETTHALDWLNTVFEKETSPSGRRDRSQRRDRTQRRLLLIDSSFPVTPEFFVTCWERNVICLCVPKKGSEYLNPFENGIIDALDKLYAEHMKKQLRVKTPYTISASQFATFIDRELGFPDRESEAEEAWYHTCLLPPSCPRLLNRRKGDRIRSQTIEPNTPTRARCRHIYLDQTNAVEEASSISHVEEGNLVASTTVPQEMAPSPQSLQSPPPRETPAEETSEEPENAVDPEDIEGSEGSDGTEQTAEQDESEQSSSDENSNANVPVTPLQTPKRIKTPKSSRCRKPQVSASSVMSLEDFREFFDQYEAATPEDKKRRREEMMIGYARCIWELEANGVEVPSSASKRSRTR